MIVCSVAHLRFLMITKKNYNLRTDNGLEMQYSILKHDNFIAVEN